MKQNIPRILFTAPASGSGKTTVCCGILQALSDRGIKITSFKCGPDYIDPMFHREVLHTPCYQLDSFFAEQETLLSLLGRFTQDAELAVMEGAMGYYDGLAGVSLKASAYDIARLTQTPVVFIVDCSKMSTSVAAFIKGFVEYQTDSHIVGVILNCISQKRYEKMKEWIESQLSVEVLGYFPMMPDCRIESRHLGLLTAGQVQNLQEKLAALGKQASETIDLDRLVKLAEQAKPLTVSEIENVSAFPAPVIAVANDDAFCFYYEENLQLLRDLGAKIQFFSPLNDICLPENADGILLGGGYPEQFVDKLSQNHSMLLSVKRAVEDGMPYIAECGGFLYLHRTLQGEDGMEYPMADVIPAQAKRTGRNSRFGYITLTAKRDQLLCRAGEQIRGHEFHYWDSDDCGDGFQAVKPISEETWNAGFVSDTCYAGYPHLYFYSNPQAAVNFCRACVDYRERKQKNDSE